MVLRFMPIFALFFAFILTSCSPQQSEIVVAKYGSYEIKMKEFEDAYAKNAGGYEAVKDDGLQKMQNFLDLYLNFKMKLRDAEVRGYAYDNALNDELLDYKKKVGVTYLLEKQLVEPGIKELYERRKKELRVSHLMLRPDSTGWEGAEELAKILMDSLNAGADFEELTITHSQDHFSRPLGGDIFYITAGLLPIEFENAAYLTKQGNIYPQPVQTQYGYHIIKVTEVRERIPQVRASHILIDFHNEEGEIDSSAALEKAESILQQIRSGADFSEMAELHTQDPSGKQNGGDLGFFERRQMVKEFDETVFNLEVGEVSDVVKTNFGYHIIKLTDKAEYPSFDDEKENLKKIYKQTTYQSEHDALIASLKERFNFALNDFNVSEIASLTDTLKVGSDLNFIDSFAQRDIFTLSGASMKAGEFFQKLNSESEFINREMNAELLQNAANKFSQDYLLEQAALELEKTNEEFASLMEDYRNGIFIFKLQEEEVWNKIQIDSVRLHEFYLQTKEKYVFPDRVSFAEIFTKSDSLANEIYAMIQNGEEFDSLVVQYTERPGFREKLGVHSLQDAKISQLNVEANKLKKAGDISAPFLNAGGYSIVKLISKEPSRIKTFEEAKAEASGAFQEHESKRLEQAYLDFLNNKYKPKTYPDRLEKAFTSN
jgi:peptidyl-prolyl cis-trans isomerase SurA